MTPFLERLLCASQALSWVFMCVSLVPLPGACRKLLSSSHLVAEGIGGWAQSSLLNSCVQSSLVLFALEHVIWSSRSPLDHVLPDGCCVM